jgi:hypothetical protein
MVKSVAIQLHAKAGTLRHRHDVVLGLERTVLDDISNLPTQ